MTETTSSKTSFVNGERAVVFLVLVRILSSIPLSLLFHGVSLSILALSALFIEIRTENCHFQRFRLETRPGASSGILLGAVTMPAVMMSKLIQLTRAYSLGAVGIEELEHVTMQYWTTSASCLAVLVLLWFLMSYGANLCPSSCVQHAKLTISCVLLYAALCCASLAMISHTGLNVALKLVWILCHGFAAMELIQHLLHTFPSCASIGESLLVTAGLVLYFGDLLAYTIAKASGMFISSDLVIIRYGTKRNEISIIVQGLLLGILLFPMSFKCVLWADWYLLRRRNPERTDSEIRRSALFFASLGITMVGIVPSWMQFVHDFEQYPLLWVLTFVFSEPKKRLSLCIYWLLLIYAAVSRFYNISRNSKMERILLRKYYHLMAVLMFLPALIYQPKFLDLAFGVALASFLILEIIRVWRIWPLGHLLHKFMNAFTDHRDSDILIVSHFSLLLGCALPMWMSSGYNDRPLSPFAGVLSLGIGDTMASVVGHKYGVLRWSKTGRKTVEGTAAGITSVLMACSVLLPVLASTGYIFSQPWFSLLLAVTASGMLEAYTAQLDNAFIPLVFYSLLCL